MTGVQDNSYSLNINAALQNSRRKSSIFCTILPNSTATFLQCNIIALETLKPLLARRVLG
jgi:hypothetical protein